MRPPYGLCLPCTIERVVDGDTVVVTVSGVYHWAIRLFNCWADESRGPHKTDKGVDAKRFAERLVEQAKPDETAIEIPGEVLAQAVTSDGINLLKILTFDRVVAVVWLDRKRSLNDVLIQTGHATREKPK